VPPKSLTRRVAKRVLGTVLGDRAYRYVQARSVVRDLRSGALSEPELDLVRHAVRPGDTVIDVGANHGMWTRSLSEAVGPTGRVYAFEPVPFTAGTLRLVVRLLRLRNVVIVEKGCGERAGRVAFAVPIQSSGVTDAALAHLADRTSEVDGAQDATRQVSAEVVALDEFLPDLNEVPLMKADIEGAELYAFRGARALIERHLPTVVSEIDPSFMDGFGLSAADALRFFGERGYRAYRYSQARGRLEAAAEPAGGEGGNYVFVHPRRADRLHGLLRAAG